MSVPSQIITRRTALGSLATASLAVPAASFAQGHDLNKLIAPLPKPASSPCSTAKPWTAGMAIPNSGASKTAPHRPDHQGNSTAQNTFLIWRKSSPANFELKAEYKLTGFNSGIQYRSIELPDIKYAMKGYQADIDGEQMFTGQIYEERGRGFWPLRGQSNYIATGQKPGIVGTLGTSDELKALIKGADWNDMHIVARSNVLVQYLNGRLMSMLIDDDTTTAKWKVSSASRSTKVPP